MNDAPPTAVRRRNPLAYVVPLIAGLLDFPYGLFIRLLSPFRFAQIPDGADTPRRQARGLTIVLGGIEGPSFYNARMVRGVLASGYRGAVRRIDWNDGILFVRSAVNLMSRRHHEREARKVVDIAVAHQAAHPCSPISIIAQSGGCWIAVRAVEMMPESLRVSTVVLHAPAISPGYDLTRAADRCMHALISVEGCGDYVIVGLGTLIFGTSDRRNRLASGLVGFRNHPPKFVAMRWRPSWVKYWNFGNHTSSASFAFVRDIVGPMLLARRGGIAAGRAC